MFKKVIGLSLAIMALTAGVFAQAEDKNDLAVSGVYMRRDMDVKNINADTFKYDAAKDSVGVEVAYTRFVNKFLGVGMEAGATFHSQDVTGTSCGARCTKNGTSNVALGYFNYVMVLQKRSGKFQPYVKGTIGAARSDFGGTTITPTGGVVGPGNLFMFGAGAGVDIKVGKKVYLRSGLAFAKGINKNTSQIDVKATTGLVFKF